MTGSHEHDYQRRVEEATGEFLPGTSIEIFSDGRGESPPAYALFDFDGTLSLVREGWVDVMVPMMVEILQQAPTAESADELAAVCREFVDELTGKQTIYQMMRLAEEVRQRGGRAAEPLEYKRLYHERLMERIEGRRDRLRSGEVEPESMLVPGSLEMLQGLADRGVSLYLASGTDEAYVREEAELLKIDRFFGPHIYGAVDDFRSFSKQMVIERLLDHNEVDASRLVGFGDGYVEIDNVKTSGGLAVGVATDESARNGRTDAWKRDRLVGVGADVIVPDFGETAALLNWMWDE
ncbi:MAG TPA: haloacid dehalogenase [Planctomycetaceae bacterium]|nr:haloacid dehalogenase [Planctomycetaceae bacterium]|tara:strand:+ start:2698 stop:3579 length:882 start_codon:yes stop_codon:yes gene_type:complete